MKRDRQNETSIISIEKHSQNYSLVDNAGIRDANLSYKATGLWTFLISHPPDWRVNLNHLINSKTDGRDSVMSGLWELSEAGYLLYLRWRSDDGLFSSRYIVFETPQLKEKYLDRMSDEDKAKITTPSNPSKVRSQKRQSETTSENPQWSQNEKTITDNPERIIRLGLSEQTNNIYTNDSETNDLGQINKTPLTPQGEPERGGDWGTLNFSQEEPKPEPEATAIAPSPQPDSKPTSCQPESLDPEINHPSAVENHSHFLPTDTTAENMEAWKAIAATGAMKGASHPDPEFLEFYRQILSKCSHYKGQNCTANHAKAALKKLWQQQPLKLLGDAENWVASKAKFSKSTQTRDTSQLTKEERLALLQRPLSAKQQPIGA